MTVKKKAAVKKTARSKTSRPAAKKKAPARKKAGAKPNTRKAARGAERKSTKPKARPGRTPAGKSKQSTRKAAGVRTQGKAAEHLPEQQSLLPPDPAIANVLDERLLVPQKVAAMAFGITVEALKKWKVKAHSRRGRETLYNLAELIKYRVTRVDANENEYLKNRAELAKNQAIESELRIEQLRGNLIPADVILENWEPLVGAARQKVLSIPTKLKTEIPALTDDDLKIITGVCRATLEDLANGGIPKRPRQVNRAAL